MITIRGELTTFSVRGQDFWGTGFVRTLHDGGELAVVGKLIGCNPGDTIELDGEHATHPRYGAQFRVRNVRVVLPSDARGVVGWLAAKLPQVSARRAEALVERYGVDGLWQRLDAEDWLALTVIDGITPDRAQEILAAYKQHRADRDRFVQFKSWGMTDNQVARVVKEWGDKAEQKMMANPYALIEFVPGFGWTRADAIALRMGVRRDDPARLAAGLLHAMGLATQAGHCFSPAGKLVGVTANKICGVNATPLYRTLDELVERGKLIRFEDAIYLPDIAAAETELAEEFAERALG
jgi:exodeoxyribonuclease V alpha subunit